MIGLNESGCIRVQFARMRQGDTFDTIHHRSAMTGPLRHEGFGRLRGRAWDAGWPSFRLDQIDQMA